MKIPARTQITSVVSCQLFNMFSRHMHMTVLIHLNMGKEHLQGRLRVIYYKALFVCTVFVYCLL